MKQTAIQVNTEALPSYASATKTKLAFDSFLLRIIAFGLIVITVLLIILISQCSFGEKKFIEASIKDQTQNDHSNGNPYDEIVKLHFKLISRDEWVAQPPNNELLNLKLPVEQVIIAHTVTNSCYAQPECMFITRSIQAYHMMNRTFDDIGYNFLIGGDGGVYEGRGWNKTGAHTKGYNAKSLGIAFIGTFDKISPTELQLKATQLLLEYGIQLGHLSNNYKLYGHRQLVATNSPGDILYSIIQNWPHYLVTEKLK